MKDFEIIVEGKNHNLFTNFLYGLNKTGLMPRETALDHLLYCFSNNDMQRRFKRNDKEFVLQNIFLADDFYDCILLWFATLSPEAIEIYCKEMTTLLLDQYGVEADIIIEKLDNQGIYKAVQELVAVMYG